MAGIGNSHHKPNGYENPFGVRGCIVDIKNTLSIEYWVLETKFTNLIVFKKIICIVHRILSWMYTMYTVCWTVNSVYIKWSASNLTFFIWGQQSNLPVSLQTQYANNEQSIHLLFTTIYDFEFLMEILMNCHSTLLVHGSWYRRTVHSAHWWQLNVNFHKKIYLLFVKSDDWQALEFWCKMFNVHVNNALTARFSSSWVMNFDKTY